MYVLNQLLVALSDGFMYSLLALGFYITYTILDFPDLTVEGTVVTGGVVYALSANAGVPPILAMLLAALAGGLLGSLTGVLHVKLKIRPLLAGILVATACLSLNLVVTMVGTGGGFDGMGGMSNVTSRHSILMTFLPENLRKPITFFLVALAVKLFLDFYLKTKSGMLLRATGSNARMSAMLGKDPGDSKILGLAIGNALAALSGSLIVQSRQNANQSMGIGMVVIGLAAVIIGLSVFSRARFMKPTTQVILGSVVYQVCLGFATALGLPSAYNKILMAILFTGALVFSQKLKKNREV